MEFFDRIKGILKPHLPNEFIDYDVKLDSNPNTEGSRYLIDVEAKRVTIFWVNLIPREKKNLQKALRECFYIGIPIIEASKEELLQKLYQYNDKEDNQILSFFKNILSPADWEVLRDALFLRNEFQQQRNVFQLKSDIVTRYSERGNIICNLCTAGYFENMMIPIYNNSITEFHKYWDLAVDRGIMALFVNVGMSIETMGKEIERRALYGISYMHIHGIGDKNIKKIKECLKAEKENINFTVKNIFENKELHVYVAEIIFG